MQSKTLQTDAHTIRYYIAGRSAGITFVLVPSIGMSSRSFEPLIERLSAQFRVVCIDLPGFGESSRPVMTPSVQEYAQEIRSVIRHEGIIRPILVGHGLGAQVVASLLAHHPETSAKAVLIAPTAAPKQRSMLVHYGKLLQDLLLEPPRVSFRLCAEFARTSPLQYAKTLPAMLRNRIDGNVAGCQSAVMIIRGADDPVVPHSWAGKLAAIATVAGLFEIRGGRHHVHMTNTEEVADIIEGFALS